MSEETSNTEPPETPAGPSEPAEEKPKVVPLSEHIELRNRAKTAEKRLKELEAAEAEREKAKLSEVERFQKEAEELRKANQELLERHERTNAFMKAKSKIGDGFTLEGIEDKVLEKIGKMKYDPETFESDVFDFVDMVKKPKAPGKGVIPFGGRGGSVGEKKAGEYSTKELAELEKSDPDRFRSVMNERRSNLGFNQNPYGQ